MEEALALLHEDLDGEQDVSLSSSIEDLEPDFPWGLLDDQVVDFAAVETSTDDISQLTAHKKRKKKVNPNKARDERPFQLIELQEQVAELEFTIEKLQSFKNKRPKTNNYYAEQDNGVPLVWQEICSRQLTRRLEVERENMRLKQQFEREKNWLKVLKSCCTIAACPATMNRKRRNTQDALISQKDT
ncbi:hypothetical protein PF005_g17643 [Phytophthora fragariae]|uniref:Uncharacterized protein n=1 Tax=Phytophthora fragariae TaxID=53985 RepID=A0A6A3TD31_9STRA|nr:hypothetical protein PF003_g32219 [Phytophthora fragariae]KAE8938983.1 hypothetical protein PF009_g11151 [Phytophthora fragariae]KAE8994943.1 hypothetical protein PF011_g16539 [Phytophthora fragariae]KAE9110406.1 hypothetical protein PF010_g11179 [Phytophthora fragariae]KAE9118707.1 hypothetical protein PF007_g8832 [Phytophthora fragariae]